MIGAFILRIFMRQLQFLMSCSMIWAKKQFTGSSLIDLGYRDYIAARFLLNNQFIIQGLTLASTAIEKYLKALIVFNLKGKERYNYHFDNLEMLKNILERNYYDVTTKFDPVFLNILEKAFKIRYYDKLEEPIRIGFYLNQFIGELDNTIHDLETLVMKMQNDREFHTPYGRAIKNNDRHLYENNFVLTNQDKKAFMEKPDTAFSVYIQTGSSSHRENTVVGRGIINKYEGRLSVFKDPFEPDWFVGSAEQ